MSYQDDHPMRGLGGSGNAYGTIPEDMYLRKIEQTNYYEDPMQVENNMRNLLRDWRPDKPFLASDEIRHSNDRGGGFGSRERLNLRHGGARSLEDPYLPDGTFLDHEFTERDPRGTALGPDMRKYVDQMTARAAFIKMYSDADYSVPEQGVNPEQMVRNIREKGQPLFKARYQNFEDSLGGWHNGGIHRGNRAAALNPKNFTVDGQIIDLAESQQINRTDATAALSADPNVAWRHMTPDHRFKIARYGQVRARQFMTDVDNANNRGSTFQDHSQTVMHDNKMVNRKLAILIADLQGTRELKQEIAKGADYATSWKSKLRQSRLAPADVYKVMQLSLASQPDAQQHGEMHRYGRVQHHNNRETMLNSEFNHEVAESMKQATKKFKTVKTSDLRDDVTYSMSDQGIYLQNENRRNLIAGKRKGIQDTEFNHYVEDSKLVKNYGGIKPGKGRMISDFDAEEYGDQSHNSIQRKSRFTAKHQTTGDFLGGQDTDLFEFGTYDRANRDKHESRGRSQQYHMDFGDNDITNSTGTVDVNANNVLNDIRKGKW